MTRREEIVTATLGCRQSYVDLKRSITPDDVADAFEKGAYWADKTMIEKACEWLQNTLYEVSTGLIKCPDVVSIESTTMGDFINNFRKTMEE